MTRQYFHAQLLLSAFSFSSHLHENRYLREDEVILSACRKENHVEKTKVYFMNHEPSTIEQEATLATPVVLRKTFVILIVDDESSNATLLSEVLVEAGYTCFYSLSGLEALQRPDFGSIRLVVTDIRMPGMSGVELAELLHGRMTVPRVIFMTGQADIEIISRAITLRPFGYLSKPFNISEFRELVDRAFHDFCVETTREQELAELTCEVHEQEKEIEFRSERLVAEQSLVQGIIGNATFGLIAVDTQLLTYVLNNVATTLLQLNTQSSKAYFGMPLIDLLPCECSKHVMNLCANVIAGGQLEESAFRNPLTDRLLNIVSYPIRHQQAIGAAVLVIHDVTDEEILQKRLLQSAKLASIGELAAGIAHEINNPLGFVTSNVNTLNGYADAVTKYLRKLGTVLEDQTLPGVIRSEINELIAASDMEYIVNDLKPVVAETLDGLERVSKIVRDLKMFARVDSDSQQLSQVNTLLEDALNLVRNETKNKLDIQKEFSEMPELLCFPTQLVQVFTNMFVNAAQATNEHGTLTIRTICETGVIHITIRDDGKGISEKHLPRIFDPFYTTKPPGKGTGMGLSISYGIIQRHGGSIVVQSEESKGTEFVISLPINGVDTQSTPKTPEEAKESAI